MPRKAKHPDQLAGHSHGRAGAAADRRASMLTLIADPVEQPDLEELLGETNPLTRRVVDGDVIEQPWSDYTLAMWEYLGDFPTCQNLQMAQWAQLARAMMLDDAVMQGNEKLASEARLRLAKFGIDPDDLLKMRIQFVAAETAERGGRRGNDNPQNSSRARRGPLTAV